MVEAGQLVVVQLEDAVTRPQLAALGCRAVLVDLVNPHRSLYRINSA